MGFLLLAACGGDDPDLGDVADDLDRLERASIELRLEAGGTGFTIRGAFSVSGDRPLPVANLRYAPLREGEPTTILLTGDDGFVEVEGVAYRLPAAQLDGLRIPERGAASAVSSIRLDEWLVDPTRQGDTYEGDGDATVVLEDILALATGLGAAEVPPVRAGTAGDIRVRVVASGTRLQELLATGDDLRFRLRLSEHGRPVTVTPPAEARPFEELGR